MANMKAPTKAPAKKAAPAKAAPPQQNAARIPFTRASRKKTRLIGTYAPPTAIVGATGTQQIAPIQVPANGYLRKLVLDVVGTAAGNAATVVFAADSPFLAIQQLTFQAANGDTLIAPIDGAILFFLNKYGAFGNGGVDATRDPNFSKVAGAGATGGSFHFQLDVPLEFDSRDGCGALSNMAANQSFLLNLYTNTLANMFTTAPTNGITLAITITAYYWTRPASHNAHQVEQQTEPPSKGVVGLIQVQTPVINASSDQIIQLNNVGNVIRFIMFILRAAGGVRDETDWPNVVQLSVNNDVWNYMTKDNWRRDMANQYSLFGGVTAVPTAGALDNGVYVYTDFMNDGTGGDAEVNGASNRNLMLPTASATALNIEAQIWGATAVSLQIITYSLKVPDTHAFYRPNVAS